MAWLRRTLILSLITFLILLVISANWLVSLYIRVETGLNENRFLQVSVIHSMPTSFRAGEIWSQQEVTHILEKRSYRNRPVDEMLFPGDFHLIDSSYCLKTWTDFETTEEFLEPACLTWRTTKTLDPDVGSEKDYAVLFGSHGRLLAAGPLEAGAHQTRAYLEPQIIAQHLEGTPLLMKWTPLGEMPPACLNAVLAIEDSNFLEHLGVSPEGLLRALYKNVLRGQNAQGGSTITQQLVKNYFLTPEKTLKRKLTEFFMAIFLERIASKDQILETYLNIIYLGQSGSFQIRGFGAAANFYFSKQLAELDPAECSLLAAVLNSPGLFDPFRHPARSHQRRDRVLQRMKDLGHLGPDEFQYASSRPLPSQKPQEISQTAPYFIEAVLKEKRKLGVEDDNVHIFTTLDPDHQAFAQNILNQHLKTLEADNPKVKKLKEKGKNLEGVVLSMENETGWITAAVGGRNFRQSQFNRLTDSKRQVGSLIKPFVYLAAFTHIPNLNPLSLVMDEAFQHKFDGRIWSPENYDRKFYGEVPVYYAFKKSLNASAAAIGIRTGIDRIAQLAQDAGVKSKMPHLPSLTLGAAELTALEVTEAYGTLARFGIPRPSRIIRGIADLRGSLLTDLPLGSETSASLENNNWLLPTETAMVVSMMRENNRSGTGMSVSRSNIKPESAGKTGTTSDSKDAWYAGFTPDRTTLVWIGYDLNESHGLTGSSGALPVWIEFMEKITDHDGQREFHWPPGLVFEKVKNLDETEEAEIATKESN